MAIKHSRGDGKCEREDNRGPRTACFHMESTEKRSNWPRQIQQDSTECLRMTMLPKIKEVGKSSVTGFGCQLMPVSHPCSWKARDGSLSQGGLKGELLAMNMSSPQWKRGDGENKKRYWQMEWVVCKKFSSNDFQMEITLPQRNMWQILEALKVSISGS